MREVGTRFLSWSYGMTAWAYCWIVRFAFTTIICNFEGHDAVMNVCFLEFMLMHRPLWRHLQLSCLGSRAVGCMRKMVRYRGYLFFQWLATSFRDDSGSIILASALGCLGCWGMFSGEPLLVAMIIRAAMVGGL